MCFNSVERPVQVYLPPATYHDALGFFLQHLTPVQCCTSACAHVHMNMISCTIGCWDVGSKLRAHYMRQCSMKLNATSTRHWVSTGWEEMCTNGSLEMNLNRMTTRHQRVVQSQRTASWKQLLIKIISQSCFMLCCQMQTNVTWMRNH